MPELTAEQIDEVANKLAQKLFDEKRALWVDPETHHQDHEWVKSKRLYESELRDLRKKIIQSAVIWAVPIVCGFVIALFWDAFKEAVIK